MNKIYSAGKKFILIIICFYVFIDPMFAVPTYDYQFVDGNGNRFILTREKLITLQYFPITLAESSSGTYSGGIKKAVFITKKQFENFILLVKDLEWKMDHQIQDRRKGTYHLAWLEKRVMKDITFPMNDKKAKEIENLLKGYLGTMNNEPDQISKLGRKFLISRDESPWFGFTGTYEDEENGKHIKSISAPVSGFQSIKTPKEILFGQDIILFRNEIQKEVIVNAKYFSDIERIDVTRLKAGESMTIGKVLDPALGNSDFLIPFLLKSQFIITYWHTNSEVTLLSESKEGDKAYFHFSGIHYYYTNEKNSSQFKFLISVDLKTGEIIVSGEN